MPDDHRLAWLLVASVDDRSNVTFDRHKLFDQNFPVLPGQTTTKTIVPRSCRAPTRLVVLRGSGPDSARVETIWSASLVARRKHAVRFEVARNGRITASIVGGEVLAEEALDGFDIDTFLETQPQILPPEPDNGLDLLILLDRIGKPEAFAPRLELATQVVEEIAAEFLKEDACKVRVLAIADDIHLETQRAREQPLPNAVHSVCEFSSPQRARAALARVEPVWDPDYDYPGAFEQVLARLNSALVRWRLNSAHVCLIITSRPPHPECAGSYFLVPAAPSFAHWRADYVEAATSTVGLTPVLATFPSDWRLPPEFASLEAAQQEYVRDCWESLTRGEPRRPTGDTWFELDDTSNMRTQAKRLCRHIMDRAGFGDTTLVLPELAAANRPWPGA